MNIKIICRRYCPNEAWTNRMLAYAKGFAENGHSVALIFLITDNNRTPYTIAIPGVKVINLWESDNAIVRMHRGLSYLWNKNKIKRYIEDGDVCLMFDASGNYIKEVQKSSKRVKLCFETTEHPKVLLRGDTQIKKYLKSLESYDHIFVISETLRKYYVEMGFESRKVQIINMFVDSDRFEGVNKTCKDKYVAYCGVVSYDKDGVNVLIESFAKFHRVFPDYKLYIIGRFINQETERKVKELAEKLKLSNCIKFTGQIPYNDIPKVLVNASILALARPDNIQNQNGFPTKLGEYLSTGNPVVVTRAGEITKFLKDKEHAYLAKCDDSEDFANKLIYVARHYDVAITIGLQGKKLALEEFSYLKQTSRFIQIVENEQNNICCADPR